MANKTNTEVREFVHNPEFDAYQAVKAFMAGQPIHENNTSNISWNQDNDDLVYIGHNKAEVICHYHDGNYEVMPWSDDEEARRIKGILMSLIRKYGLKYSNVFMPRGIEAADNANDGFEARKEQMELEEAISRAPRGKRA